MYKKICALILSVVLIITLFPAHSFAYADECEHSFTAELVAEANCQHGNQYLYTCEKCGYQYSDDDGIIGDHNIVKVDAVKPTVYHFGNVEYQYCTVCLKHFNMEGEEIDPESVILPELDEPRLESISIDKTTVYWGDTISFRLDYVADREYKSTYIIAYSFDYNESFGVNDNYEDEEYGLVDFESQYDPETHKGTLIVHKKVTTANPVGEYFVNQIGLYDFKIPYELSEKIYNKEITFNIKIKEGLDAYFFRNAEGDLAEKLKELKDGDNVVVKLYSDNAAYPDNNDHNFFRKEYFDAIKGKDITVFIIGSFWNYITFNAKDITGETKDVKLEGSLGGSGRADADDGGPWFALEFTFPNNGILPCKVRYYYLYDFVYKFTKEGIDSRYITADDVMRDMELYYVNKGVLVREPNGIDTNDDWIILELDHNSKFVASSFSPKIMKSYTAKLSSDKFVYNGKVQKPTVKCSKSGCTIEYSNKKSKNIGKYKVTVHAPANGYGTYTFNYKINPPKVTGLKLTSPKSKQLKITWSKASGGVYYNVWYRVKGTSTWKKTTATGTSKLLKSLKGGKTYQVKVRAYKKVDGTTYTGAWTAIKSLKVKK